MLQAKLKANSFINPWIQFRIRSSLPLSLLLGAALVCAVSACGPTGGMGSESTNSAFSGPGNFKLSLTDAPNDELKSVVVDVAEAEIRLKSEDREARVHVVRDVGRIDLLKLQGGTAMTLGEINLPIGIKIKEIRLVLRAEGHFAVKADGSVCEMKTPDSLRAGIRLKFKTALAIEAARFYAVTLDFDANRSVKILEGGACSLKPVLKLKSVYRMKEGWRDARPEDATPNHNGGAAVGWDETPEADLPPIIGRGEIGPYFEQ